MMIMIQSVLYSYDLHSNLKWSYSYCSEDCLLRVVSEHCL